MTDRALHGRRVAVLRAGGPHDAVRDALAERGASATTVVVATIHDRADDEVRAGVGDLARFCWVAVTSSNAARRLRLWSAAWPPTTRVAAVGGATAAAVGALGLGPAVVAPEGTARSLADVIDAGPVCFLAASSARDDLAGVLAARDVDLVTVVAYDVARRALEGRDVADVLASDALVATSPVAIDALCDLDAAQRPDAARIPLIAIGPTTEQHAIERGWTVACTARTREPSSVADAVGLALSTGAAPLGGRARRR